MASTPPRCGWSTAFPPARSPRPAPLVLRRDRREVQDRHMDDATSCASAGRRPSERRSPPGRDVCGCPWSARERWRSDDRPRPGKRLPTNGSRPCTVLYQRLPTDGRSVLSDARCAGCAAENFPNRMKDMDASRGGGGIPQGRGARSCAERGSGRRSDSSAGAALRGRRDRRDAGTILTEKHHEMAHTDTPAGPVCDEPRADGGDHYAIRAEAARDVPLR